MKSFIKQLLELDQNEYDLFLSKTSFRTFNEREWLLKAGNKVDRLFFLEKGMLRGYRIIDGIEITHHFFKSNWFATDYEAFLTGQPGELCLETIDPVSIYEIKKDVLEQLYSKHVKFERMGRIIAETAYLNMVSRNKDFQTKDLKKRYNDLLNEFPSLFDLVPQKDIATYLGVAPESLSRLKKNI